MDITSFSNIIDEECKAINIELNKQQKEKLYKFMNTLLEWNEKMNLTAITEPNDIILKHFVDSLTINKYIKENAKVVDVGTGAGFPGIPLSILRNDIEITLIDSLNKRINFLNIVTMENTISNACAIHSRAEEFAKNANYREKFDVATSRAVASLSVLLEYMLPLVKIGGYCVCMKGTNVEDEIENSKNALKILGGQIEKVDTFNLPDSDFGRNIVIVKKIKETPSKYPRKAGTPAKEPL